MCLGRLSGPTCNDLQLRNDGAAMQGYLMEDLQHDLMPLRPQDLKRVLLSGAADACPLQGCRVHRTTKQVGL